MSAIHHNVKKIYYHVVTFYFCSSLLLKQTDDTIHDTHTHNMHMYCMYMVCVQFSGEELKELRGEAWENPAFDNMDQLMDER